MNLPPLDMLPAGPGEARFALHLGPDHPAFRGHFPGQPVLAGVIQLDWAMQLAELQLGLGQRAAADLQVKYRRILPPGRAVTLHLRLDRARQTLRFEYLLEGDSATIGQIRLEQA